MAEASAAGTQAAAGRSSGRFTRIRSAARGLVAGVGMLRRAAPGLALAVPVSQLLYAVVPVLALVALQYLVDAVAALPDASSISSGGARSALFWALVTGIFALSIMLLQTESAYLARLLGLRLDAHVQDRIHTHTLALDLARLEQPKFHDELHRAHSQGLHRPALVAQRMATTLGASLSLVGTAALLVAVEWVPLALIAAATLPGMVVGLRHSRSAHEWDRRRTPTDRVARALSQMLMAPAYAKEVRIYGLARPLQDRYREVRDQLMAGDLEVPRRRMQGELWVHFLGATALIAGLVWVLARTAAGAHTVGTVVMYYAALRRMASAASQFHRGVTGLYEDGLFLDDLLAFLDTRPVQRGSGRNLPVRPLRSGGGITFENVTFRYPGTTRDVLSNLDLSLESGRITAIVGRNGAGKSTLVKLLLGLYEPTSGRVLYDGVDVRDLEPEAYRAQFAVAFQDFARFPLSLRMAVGFGAPHRMHDDAAILAALRMAGAESLPDTLPAGLDTPLARWFEGGTDLSIGQWQRVALARAFFADKPIVVVDEPTASLDPIFEADLFDRMRELLRRRTALLISHRLGSVRRTDHIFVMEAGTVVESGTHDALMAHGGLYARMYEKQVKQYRPAEPAPTPT